MQKFRGNEKARLLDSPIDRYFKVELPKAVLGKQDQAAASSPSEVVLALSNGDPLIVAQSIRRGRVVLVTTSGRRRPGACCRYGGTYEPLVKEILAWCTAGQAQPRNLEVGDPLESSLAADAGGEGKCRSNVPAASAGRCPWSARRFQHVGGYNDTLISGIYTAHYASPLQRKTRFLPSTWPLPKAI